MRQGRKDREPRKAIFGLFHLFIILLVFAFLFVLFFFVLPTATGIEYDQHDIISDLTQNIALVSKEIPVSHMETPKSVRAIYMTSWVAGTKNFRRDLIDLIDTTELNAVVIDIKDYSGAVAFKIEDDSYLKEMGTFENRIPDIKEFLEHLHKKNIYAIGRIAVFQDPKLVAKRPDLAVRRKSDGEVWKDYKGISWLDTGSEEVWKYTAELAKKSYEIGFDEINFDYIRFPSDGNMKDIKYPFSESKIKAEVVGNFFSYLNQALSKSDVVTSADLFGMTTTNYDDLNIGQVLETALLNFDFVAPMVYPSHYPTGFIGINNPASKPYEVVKYSMDKAVARTFLASTTPKQLRPWLQDFDLGADYNAEMVRAQIRAVYDAGVESWMIWAASNIYTKEALLSETVASREIEEVQ